MDEMRSSALTNKIFLVTGATDGIGWQTALQLAMQSGHVLIHGRNSESAEQAIFRMHQIESSLHLSPLAADFSSLEEIRQMAEVIRADYPHLDTLVNNAGVYTREKTLSKDKLELTFQVNYLAPFLLTHLLLPLMLPEEGMQSRIVNVTSAAHVGGHLDPQEFSHLLFTSREVDKTFSPYKAYAFSKLALVMFTYELARRTKNLVSVNCLHPGVVNTKLLRVGFPGAWGASPEEGSSTSVFLASALNVEGITGRYFVRKRPVLSSTQSYDQSLSRWLWQESFKLLETHLEWTPSAPSPFGELFA